MQLPTVLMACISLATGLIGMVFLLFPARIRALEARLNEPWGDHELVSLRFGLHGEQLVEQAMNRPVVTRQIVWDDWLRRHPRPAGVVLCLLAAWLAWHL